MELSGTEFGIYMSPTFAYSKRSHKDFDESTNKMGPPTWEESYNNPKSRIESLSPMPHATWVIDGGEADGTQFFAIPSFARGRPPLRIDVYIPPSEKHPRQLREVLKSDSGMHLPSTSVGRSFLAQHIVRALEVWTYRYSGLEEAYFQMPFGSKIVIPSILPDVKAMTIELVPDYSIEHSLLSIKQLQQLWDLDNDKWPPEMSLDHLELVFQPYPTISLVRVQGRGDRLYVFKSNPDDYKYFYHELKSLLTLEPHPNIIGRPEYVVTRQVRFGGKKGVCGFVLPYHRAGTLRDILSQSCQRRITFEDKLRWAQQITSALIHLLDSPTGFFTNLKLNNIVMAERSGQLDAVLIDFEQRLGPASWSPPEVHCFSYLESVANTLPNEAERTRIVETMRRMVPEWKQTIKGSKYDNPEYGYCQPWPTLAVRGQAEAAQVFMLGKLLWCIFEHRSTLNITVSIDTFREEASDQAFPEFRTSPLFLRDCIKACTAGAMGWQGRSAPVLRRGTKLYASNKPVAEAEVSEVEQVMRYWWREQISLAKQVVEAYAAPRPSNAAGRLGIAEAKASRPSLAEVLCILDSAVLELGTDDATQIKSTNITCFRDGTERRALCTDSLLDKV